jgi:hypothetical protein
VFLQVDYTVPVESLREQYQHILDSSPLWDRKKAIVQVTDAKEHTVEIRFLMSAATPSATFDLRCQVRERLLQFLQREQPQSLPQYRHRVALSS